MPLEQRVVEPICVSRGTLPLDSSGNLAIAIPNELECVTNGTLANLIRQLSSLSRHAEDLFGGIVQESTRLIARATSLQGRIERLGVKVTQLDSSVEEVSLHDIHLRKPYKSCNNYDQQVVSRQTMSTSVAEKYEMCDKPPPLDKLNPYRDDGKDGLKFYTDPNYFFELWKQEMLKETEKERSGKKGAHRGPGKQGAPGSGEKNRQKKPRQPANTRERYRQMVAQHEFLECGKGTNAVYMDGNGLIYTQQYGTLTQRPNSLELNQYIIDNYHNMAQYPQAPPSYFGTVPNNSHYNNNNMHQQMQQMTQIGSPNHMIASNTPPPPYNQITPQEIMNNSHGHVNSQQNMNTQVRRATSVASRPSQPPPAPPSNPPSSSSSSGGTPTVGTPSRDAKSSSLAQEILQKQQQLRPPKLSTLNKVLPQMSDKPTDARSDLLAAIREGIKLRRVQDCKQKEVEKSAPLHDVASILARRVAMEMSDSESGGGSSDGSDSDGWDDESEC
ncbi:wiskott-Aldrich syndrome protein family member 3-like isoform X2 [Dinothrombium tinctorium]|uniref:Wiskott-Aldrich syndrome protein family member n=1 Tax=Dinothrombium tinctorium TaxID=1965070 RepID=A0A443QQW7_9ACAR|nr:wiskott-Aldrich syndrome protein family member 3-like isoform X2 [Dinothrombium tinctorium]